MADQAPTTPAPRRPGHTFGKPEKLACRVLAFSARDTSSGAVPVLVLVNEANEKDTREIELWLNGISVEKARIAFPSRTTFSVALQVADKPDTWEGQAKNGDPIKRTRWRGVLASNDAVELATYKPAPSPIRAFANILASLPDIEA